MIKEAVYYTDGACSNDTKIGGWGFLEIAVDEADNVKVYDKSGNKENTTNNVMELSAAYYALLRAYKSGAKKVVVYSDSSYVVNGVVAGWLRRWKENGWVTTTGREVKNKNIWDKMYALCYEKGMNVSFVRVKGHSDDILNSYVDRLAVNAKLNVGN